MCPKLLREESAAQHDEKDQKYVKIGTKNALDQEGVACLKRAVANSTPQSRLTKTLKTKDFCMTE